MRRPAVIAMLVGTLLAATTPEALAQAPWFGSWQQQLPAPANRFEPAPYRRVTLRIEPWEEGIKVTYDMVRARGGITHVEWTGRFDGRDYPVAGVDTFMTNAYRQIDDRSYEIVIKIDGRTVATATATVSPDGRTMTVQTVERDARGRAATTTAIYQRH